MLRFAIGRKLTRKIGPIRGIFLSSFGAFSAT